MSVIRFAEGNQSYGPNIELEGVPDDPLHTSFFFRVCTHLTHLSLQFETSSIDSGPIVYEIVKLSSTKRASDL